jgi:molybdopterin/thiamine biosynthesis adenylyltransferase
MVEIRITGQRGEDPNFVGQEAQSEEEGKKVISITQEDITEDRYHRLRLINWWDQTKLAKSIVIIAGAGALGNEAIKNLALLGVGRLIVCDFDGIETSNLTRSVLFRQGDVGRLKVDVACERAMEMNPDTKAVPVHGDLRFVLGYGLVRRAGVILGCLDSLEARYYLNHHAMKTGAVYIDAGLDHLNGDVMTFNPVKGPCYECQMKSGEKKELKRRQSCLKLSREDIALGKVPTSPTISAIIAGMQSQIAVRHLHGRPIPAGRRLGLYGMTDLTFDITLSEDPECLTHMYTDPLGELEIIELARKASSTTVDQLLSDMKEKLGEPVVWSLDDDRDIITGLSCRDCKKEREILSLVGVLAEKDALCDGCGEVMMPRQISQFDGSEGLGDKTLEEIGIPPLHILYGRNVDSGEDAYFELTGDVDLYFGD